MERKKRNIVLIGLLGLWCLLGLSACSQAETVPENGTAIQLYRLNREETRLVAEEFYLETEGTDAQVGEVMEAMQANSEVVQQKAPMEMGFAVNGYRVEENQLVCDVDSNYYKLPVTTEVLVRAAIVRNVSQVKGIDHVVMTVAGEPLLDSLGNPVGTMSADQFIDNAGDEINTYEKVDLTLYFADESGEHLISTMKSVVYNSNISMERLVVEELIKGPGKESNVYPLINPETKIVSVTVKDGICYVNLDNNFLTQIYNVTGDVVLFSIVNSLVELPNVNKVQFFVNGKSDLVFRETLNLNTVFERNLELITESSGAAEDSQEAETGE